MKRKCDIRDIMYICFANSACAAQYLIFVLNSTSDAEFLISSGTISHVFGPLKASVSVPLYTEWTLVDFVS